jgi:hypothetical protein
MVIAPFETDHHIEPPPPPRTIPPAFEPNKRRDR